MRIGLVIPAVPGYSETFFRSKIKGLQDKGHEVILFIGSGNPRQGDICKVCCARRVSRSSFLMLLSVCMTYVELMVRSPFSCIRFVRLEIEDGFSLKTVLEHLYINFHILTQKLDWLHFGFATMVLGRENAAKAIGAKMAISFRGYDVCIYPIKNGFDCYQHIWSKVDKVHTISDDLLGIAYNRLGLLERIPVTKITPALNVERFRRQKISVGLHSPVRLLTVGRLHWKKGIDYAIEAAARLKRDGLDYTYTIIGDGESYEQLSFLIHQLDLNDRVFLAGKKAPEEVASLMHESDIYLQPSVSEGFCNAVLEAQAAGLLCIVSDAEGLPENVINHETGWVFPKRKIAALISCINTILAMDKDQIKQVRERAVERVANEFYLEKQTNYWSTFYTS